MVHLARFERAFHRFKWWASRNFYHRVASLNPDHVKATPGKQPAVPEWLTQVLTTVVKMPPDQVDRLTEEQAQEIWDAYISTPR